jgi:type IV pilus assembly protein PilO
MAYTEEYLPAASSAPESSYPTVFGITLTPKVGGIAAGIVGLLAFAYLILNQVMPLIEANSTLDASVKAQEEEVKTQKASLGKMKQAKQGLSAAEGRQKQVTTLFANEQSIDTILLDVNQLIQSKKPKLALQGFEPKGPIEIIADSSLGEGANNKLKRQSYSVKLKGAFTETKDLIQQLERLQPLVRITDMNSKVDKLEQSVTVAPTGRVSISRKEPELTTEFTLQMLMPRPAEELAAEAEAAAAAAAAAAAPPPAAN